MRMRQTLRAVCRAAPGDEVDERLRVEMRVGVDRTRHGTAFCVRWRGGLTGQAGAHAAPAARAPLAAASFPRNSLPGRPLLCR